MTAASYGKRKWQTKNGSILSWSDMTTRHLRNAAQFLENNALDRLSALYGMSCMVSGEAAMDALDSAIQAEDEDNYARYQCAKDMRAYADWREHEESQP
jgi:hypothetical protein